MGIGINALHTPTEVDGLLPYTFLAILGKRVIHPGGRRSTKELFRLADLHAGQRVLEVGCGVGTTAMEIARRFGCDVTAVDIDPHMLERARANVRATGLAGRVTIEEADIQELPFRDQAFDRVIIESVLEFVDHAHGLREVFRVCRLGGRLLDHEFVWREQPPPEVLRLFEGEICPPSRLRDWIELYRTAGLRDMQVVSGVPTIMTPTGFLNDEGLVNSLAIVGRTLTHWSYLRKMAWLMRRLRRVVPYLGWVVVGGVKSA